MKPFEARSLHPERGPRDGSREDVEGAANSYRHTDVELVAVGGDPLVLTWGTQGDEQEARAASIDAIDDLPIRAVGERTEGRGVGSGDPGAGIASRDRSSGRLRDAGATAKQKDARARHRGEAAAFLHEGVPRHALGEWSARQA